MTLPNTSRRSSKPRFVPRFMITLSFARPIVSTLVGRELVAGVSASTNTNTRLLLSNKYPLILHRPSIDSNKYLSLRKRARYKHKIIVNQPVCVEIKKRRAGPTIIGWFDEENSSENVSIGFFSNFFQLHPTDRALLEIQTSFYSWTV